MRVMESRLLKIMYAPGDYILPEHLDAFPYQKAIKSNALLNEFIIEQHQLSRNIDFSFTPGPFISSVIKGWQHIPRAAMLTGCHLLRTPLIFSGTIHKLDAICRSFTKLPLTITLPAQPLNAITTETLQSTGASTLIATLRNFSPALAQRASLMFPASLIKTSDMITPSILIMAFDYAKIS